MPTLPAPDPWLVVIDMQHAFTDPASGWYAEGVGAAAVTIDRLLARFAGRVVSTRFVRDPAEPGAWAAYYDTWSEFRLPPEHPRWDLAITLPPGAPVIDEPTFSKWTARLAAVVDDADLVLCGVATECCVLSTAFGAADAGRRVTVVGDGCAGATVAAHDAALAIMAANAPLIDVVTADQLLAAR